MKRLGIILIAIFTLPTVIAQPLEYHGQPSASFCQRIFHFVKEKPTFTHRTQPAYPGYLPPIRQPNPNSMQHVPLNRHLPEIGAVYIRGGVDLQLVEASGENQISIACQYPGLAIKVCNGAIYISNSKPVDCNLNPRPRIKLHLSRLQQLVVAGDSCVTGYHINTACGLEINHCGSGSVCLAGPVHLVRVINNGSAAICVRNVASDHVHVLATHRGVVDLRGCTGLLLVRAFDNAVVDTRFMHSHTALAQAHDEALVTINTTGTLRAFATGQSNIYYYAKPGDLLKHTIFSGNVFYMGCGC